jgi:hypothetical protein
MHPHPLQTAIVRRQTQGGNSKEVKRMTELCRGLCLTQRWYLAISSYFYNETCKFERESIGNDSPDIKKGFRIQDLAR